MATFVILGLMYNPLIMKKYISIGLKDLYKGELVHVIRPKNDYSFKPSGGIWATEYTPHKETLCPWLSFLEDNSSYERLLGSDFGILITLKDEANICYLDCEQKLEDLYQSYPSIHHQLGYHNQKTLQEYRPLNFEKMADDFDGFFVDLNGLCQKRKEGKGKNVADFGGYDVSSLILFNLDCIEYYETLEFCKDRKGTNRIKSKSDPKRVIEISEAQQKLTIEINRIVGDIFPIVGRVSVKTYLEYLNKSEYFYNKAVEYIYILMPKELKEMIKICGYERTYRVVLTIMSNLLQKQFAKDELYLTTVFHKKDKERGSAKILV